MNIVYAGSSGPLSEIPLAHLLSKGINITALVVTAETSAYLAESVPLFAGFPLQSASAANSLSALAQQHNIPVFEFTADSAQLVETLRDLRTDLILVSCFAKRLPVTIYELPPRGCFNLHPSLLPAFRGPDPVYWQHHSGVQQTGVTVHKVIEAFDAGEIAVQKKLILEPGAAIDEMTRCLAELGADAMLELVRRIESGQLELTPQDETRASYYGYAD